MIVPASFYFLILTMIVNAADDGEPPRREECHGFVVAIVLAAVLGFLLGLAIMGFIILVLRSRRSSQGTEISNQLEVAVESVKDLQRDDHTRRSQIGTGIELHAGETVRSIGVVFEGAGDVPGVPSGEENATARSVVKGANTSAKPPPICKQTVEGIPKVTRLFTEGRVSPRVPQALPTPSLPTAQSSLLNTDSQAQLQSRFQPISAPTQDCQDSFLASHPCVCGNRDVGQFVYYPLVSTAPFCRVCQRRIEGVLKVRTQDTGIACDLPPRKELKDMAQQTDARVDSQSFIFNSAALQQYEHSVPTISNPCEQPLQCANFIDSDCVDSMAINSRDVCPSNHPDDRMSIYMSDPLTQIQIDREEVPQNMRLSEPTMAYEFEAVSVDPPAPALTTTSEFRSHLDTYVSTTGLEMFYTASMNTDSNNYSLVSLLSNSRPRPGPAYLHTIAQNAAALRFDLTTSLGTPQNIRRLTRLSLYHPVIFCDDSNSMAGKPFELQRQLVLRIVNVATKIVPPRYGVDLYFINSGSFYNLNAKQIENALKTVLPCGWTPIGTNLRSKILQPLVYDVINRGQGLDRPLLICIVTDGCPTEAKGTFKDAIVECRRFLQNTGYKSTAVRFSISQLGMDPQAAWFLDILRSDREIEDMIRVTTDRVDEKYEELRGNERELETWLLKVLTNPIMEMGSF